MKSYHLFELCSIIWLFHWITPPVETYGTPWLFGPCYCDDAEPEHHARFEGVDLHGCLNSCTGTSRSSKVVLWSRTQKCLCLEDAVSFAALCHFNRSSEDEAEEGNLFVLLPEGPVISDADVSVAEDASADASVGMNVKLTLTALVRRKDLDWDGWSFSFHLEVYWFLDRKLVKVEHLVLPSDIADEQSVESSWNASLDFRQNITLCVVLSTGLSTVNVTKNGLDLQLSAFKNLHLARCSVELVQLPSNLVDIYHLDLDTDAKGFWILVTAGQPSNLSSGIAAKAAAKTTKLLQSFCVSVEVPCTTDSRNILNKLLQNPDLKCGMLYKTLLESTENFFSISKGSFERMSTYLNSTVCSYFWTHHENSVVFLRTSQACIQLEYVVIVCNPYVATQSPSIFTADIHPKDWNCDAIIDWTIKDENGTTVFRRTTTCDLVLTFHTPGVYWVTVTVMTLCCLVQNQTSVNVQEPIADVLINSPKPTEYVALNSNMRFLAEASSGTDVHCLWDLRCTCLSPSRTFEYLKLIDTCNSTHKFRTPAVCSLSVKVSNEVSSIILRDRFTIYAEEPVMVLDFYVPPKVQLKSVTTVLIFVKGGHQDKMVDIDVDSVRQRAIFDSRLNGFKALSVFEKPGVQMVRLRVHNNVSSVVLRKYTYVLEEIQNFDVVINACGAFRFPPKFFVLVNGVMPTSKEPFLYHWHLETEQKSYKFYTSVPMVESKDTLTDNIRVTVKVSNEVSSSTGTLSLNFSGIPEEFCLHHSAVFNVGQWIDITLLGLSPEHDKQGVRLDNMTLEVKNDRSSSSSLKPTIFSNTSRVPRWRYICQSSGFHSVKVHLGSSNISSDLSFQSGFVVSKRLHSVRITTTRTKFYLQQGFPLFLTFDAEVEIESKGCIFTWTLHGFKYVTAVPQVHISFSYPAGIYKLELEARNAFESVESSMSFEIVSTLLLLNYSLSNFFVGQNGRISLEINQPSLPETVFVDFGDDSFFDSNKADSTPSTVLGFVPSNSSSVLTLNHTYSYAGQYDIFVNVTHSAGNGFDHWISIVVEEKISDVRLLLLSPAIVELLEEITVACVVKRGTNLHFKWDFGDGLEGEQYTRQETYQVDRLKTNSTAYHSYGIANIYNVSVHVFNTYESVTAHLNVSIHAVERIVELHLHPRIRGRYAAPLYKNKLRDGTTESAKYSTAAVEFETGVWRGSDVQFMFDFGDGTQKWVSALLNAWSLPYAIAKHSYTAEGVYNVSVTATNLLSSVSVSLGRPFYVQFPPENLMLDRQYYIIRHHENVSLLASVSQGTHVSFNWKVGDMEIADAGSTLFLPVLSPGIYLVVVEAFNHVTDFGYSVIRRPNATAKIYVQEKLLGIQICVLVNNSENCDLAQLDWPLDEEVHFHARVFPSTETVLRFIWQLGAQEIRRTNVPYFVHRYQQAGWYSINVTAQNHISSISSSSLQLHLVQKAANLTSIFCKGPNLVDHPITYRALYWFGTNLTFHWDFGDGSPPLTTTSSSVQHTYKEVGEYWVSVSVWNQFSHANITTNMFFLPYMCRKPEINFLHPRNRIARYDDDVLLEADISVVCKTVNVEYFWTLRKQNGDAVDLGPGVVLHQRQLILPRYSLSLGSYEIHLKVSMVNTIVYAESSVCVEIVFPKPFVYIEGGFVHWVGTNDTQHLTARVLNDGNLSHPLRYTWSCAPQVQKHLPCFRNAPSLHLNPSPMLPLHTSDITPSLGAVVINVTLEKNELLTASQVFEIKPVPHMLYVDVDCEDCHDHHVNQQDKILMKAVCNNCGNALLEYQWKIWIIEDGKFRLHFGNYECVQADGSTFFIVAQNDTDDENVITHQPHENSLTSDRNTSQDHMLSEKPYESRNEDLPPFPNLPGFPEENNTSPGHNLSRSTRDAPEEVYENLDLIPSPEYLNEGEADYEDNSTFLDFPYPDFMPFPVPDLSEGPDYLITEEGMPGESGSAAARHQSSQNLGVILSEDEDQILEGAGKPRVQSSENTNIFVRKSNELGDPLRDGLGRKRPFPHIVSRPRGLLVLPKSATTTGLNSEYFILKPGLLKVGRSYLVQARIKNLESGVEGFAMEYFKVNTGPFKGRCTLMPVDGYSIHFDFRLHCFEWKSDHLPLYYELSYSRKADDFGHLIYIGLNGNVKFNLPSGFAATSHEVYLNVVVRDSFGTSTKVCSIVRNVKPMEANISLEHIIYNETFHPKSSLRKLVGEKNNQAILQKLHVLASSLNTQETSNQLVSNSEFYEMRTKIRQGIFEILSNLYITTKVEAVQLISVLNEIIADVQTMKLFELQKAYNIYKKIHSLQADLFDFFSSDHLHRELVKFSSGLAFAAHSIHPPNEELIEVSRTNIMNDMIDFLESRLKVEEPFQVGVAHLSAAATFLTRENVCSTPFIQLRKSAIHVLDHSHFNSHLDKESEKKCQTVNEMSEVESAILVAQEYDYVSSSPQTQTLWDSPALVNSSVLLFSSFYNGTWDPKMGLVNVSVHFMRPTEVKNKTKISLKKNYMNVHAINITEKQMGRTLLFYMKRDVFNITKESAGVDIMFRHLSHPTLTKYDFKKSFSAEVTEMNLIMTPDKIKVPGLYFIGILNNNLHELKNSKESGWQYEASLWGDVCLGRVPGYWSSDNCRVLETSDHNWTRCRCSSQEVTASSVPLVWDLSHVLLNDLIEPFFNPLPLLAFVVMTFLYCMQVYWNFHKDQMRSSTDSPIPLRDNNSKHRQLYLVCLKTGYFSSSGTTASVFVVLHGTKDVTETRQLIAQDDNKLCFQKGSSDVFLLSTERNLGPLLKLQVWHDNQGVSPSWYLNAVSVKDLNTGSIYSFDCYDWLAAETGDGQIERELAVGENPLPFSKTLYQMTVMYMNDFNMWPSFTLDPPVSFFTGFQRTNCCWCFIINSSFLLALFGDYIAQESMEEDSLPVISHQTLYASVIAALIASAPQIFYTILFRFSKKPNVAVNPKFADFFSWLSPYSVSCLLKPKRSNSSRSTDRSPSSAAGSDSLYSSFEDSSIMSLPDLMEETYFFEEEEKDIFPLSFSCSDISDPVSPLQKTLSTWQTLENWLKKKQDLILKPDIMLMNRHPYINQSNSDVISERLSQGGSSSFQEWQQSTSSSGNTLAESDPTFVWHEKKQRFLKELDTYSLLPCLPSAFYYLTWCLMITNLIGASVFTLILASSFSISYSILLFKSVLICVACSCLAITPLVILLLTVVHSFYCCFLSGRQKSQDAGENLHVVKNNPDGKLKKSFSGFRSIDYFKKYLRPPREQVLEQFRLVAFQEKRLCRFYRDIFSFFVVLVLLCAATYSDDIQMKFLQKSSIEKVLFKSIPQTTKRFLSKDSLLSWLETDFLDGFSADHQCYDTDEDCGISTRCYFVGNIILRHFYSNRCLHLNRDCSSNHNNSDELYHDYERRELRGNFASYFKENERKILTNQIFYSYDEIHDFVDKLNTSSGAASIEFLLFNPTFVMFTSVSLLFEATSAGTINVFCDIVPVIISINNDLSYYLKIFFNLIFLIFMLFNCKSMIWKMMKHPSQFWKQTENYVSCLFIFVYFTYLVLFVLYVVACEKIALKLHVTQLRSNVNVTKVAVLEKGMHVLGGTLMFLHIVTLLKVFSFSERLKKMLQRLKHSLRKILILVSIFFSIILSSAFMMKHLIASSFLFLHPLFSFTKVVASIFSSCGSPDVTLSNSALEHLLNFFISVTMIIIHLYLFSIIRSIMLTYKNEQTDVTKKEIKFRETNNLIKRKLISFFKPDPSKTHSQIEYVPQIDFFLYELERLADTLVIKANNLFPEENREDIFPESECQHFLSKPKLESGLELLQNAMVVCSSGLSEQLDYDSQERLIATVPRRNKNKLNACLPSSFHSSIGSEKKYQNSETSAVSLQNRIRKTYPLSNLDSDSSATSTCSELEDEKLNSVTSLLVRRTKSRGKGKSDDLELSVETSDHDLNEFIVANSYF